MLLLLKHRLNLCVVHNINPMDDKNTAILQQMNQKIKTDTKIPQQERKQLEEL